MSVPSWLSSPAPSASQEIAPPKSNTVNEDTNQLPPDPTYGNKASKHWPSGKTSSDILSMISLLQAELIMEIVEGNSASEAMALLTAFETAIRDHEVHGANWFAKHRDELLAHLRSTGLFPWLGKLDPLDVELEGLDLAVTAWRVFGRPGPKPSQLRPFVPLGRSSEYTGSGGQAA